jgi:integrase
LAKALTTKRIEKIEGEPKPASRLEIPDGLLTGLYLVRQTSGALSWAVRYRHEGQTRKLTLGSYPAVGLGIARDLGAQALRAAAEGRDPADEKKAAKVAAQQRAAEIDRHARDLFENVAREFIDRHAMKKTRPSSWGETARILGLGLQQNPGDAPKLVETGAGVIAAWKGRKIQDIAKRDVNALLDGIADRGAPIMANRTLSAVRKLCNWALSRDIITASPCAGVEPPAPPRSRARVLDDIELRLVWQAADNEGWPFGPIVKLMILTGQREGETVGLRWAEIDLNKKLWTIPAERAKNHEQHTVPLSDAAVEIIKSLRRVKSDNDLVFVGRNGRQPTSFSRVKARLDEAITEANQDEPITAWVFHDLRRTMASGMERLGIAPPVIEKCLNHKSGTFRGVTGVYLRFTYDEEKRAALDAWAQHVVKLQTVQSVNG